MFGYTMNTTYMNLTIFNFFSAHFGDWKPTKSILYYLFIISVFGNISPLEKEKKKVANMLGTNY
jgi:hypothetical protein